MMETNIIRYVLRVNDTLYNTWSFITAGGVTSAGKISWFLEEDTFATWDEADAHINAILESGWYRKDITKDNFQIIPVRKFSESISNFYITDSEAELVKKEK